ncbi:MAG: acyl-CoA thioesterase [Comamonadaceae bacterium]|nr:acyl-CoA thioesterase [Comamonadaceae bacterium]
MEIVWHGHYVKYLELARCALLQRLDYDYPQMRASGYAWPVVDLRIKYVRSLEFGQRVTVQARIVEWENRLRIDYLIRDAETGRKLTTAQTTQVAVDMATRELCFVCPPVLWERLGVSP